MDDYVNNTSQDNGSNYSNITLYCNGSEDEAGCIMFVVTCVIISMGLPLTLMAIYALYSMVRNDHVAPIFVINLLISDLIQLCCLIVWVSPVKQLMLTEFFYFFGLTASVGFMVCVALERYLVIACPLWYHFRRSIKSSVVVCVVVWTLPLVFLFPLFFSHSKAPIYIFGIFFLLPLPLFIFFLGGTLKALTTSRVPSNKKRQVLCILVLVLLIYTLLFLPSIILYLAEGVQYNSTVDYLSFAFLNLSPLADLALYVFLRKGTMDKILASVCCCRVDSNDVSRSEE